MKCKVVSSKEIASVQLPERTQLATGNWLLIPFAGLMDTIIEVRQMLTSLLRRLITDNWLLVTDDLCGISRNEKFTTI